MTVDLGNTNGVDLLLVGCQHTQDRIPTTKTISLILPFFLSSYKCQTPSLLRQQTPLGYFQDWKAAALITTISPRLSPSMAGLPPLKDLPSTSFLTTASHKKAKQTVCLLPPADLKKENPHVHQHRPEHSSDAPPPPELSCLPCMLQAPAQLRQ